jgi:hypothetical protein
MLETGIKIWWKFIKNIILLFDILSHRAGTPTAIDPAGMSFVTTDPAPITQCDPMVTLETTVTLAPIQTSS